MRSSKSPGLRVSFAAVSVIVVENVVPGNQIDSVILLVVKIVINGRVRGEEDLGDSPTNEVKKLVRQFYTTPELKIVLGFFVSPYERVWRSASNLKPPLLVRHKFKDQRDVSGFDSITACI